MADNAINNLIPNNEMGIFLTATGRVEIGTIAAPKPFPLGMATAIKAGTAGDVVWQNGYNGRLNVTNFEAGETQLLICDRILATGTVDGAVETTGATNLIWGITNPSLVPA